jgi:hypothetical protein
VEDETIPVHGDISINKRLGARSEIGLAIFHAAP